MEHSSAVAYAMAGICKIADIENTFLTEVVENNCKEE